jgi:hypothetical protein
MEDCGAAEASAEGDGIWRKLLSSGILEAGVERLWRQLRATGSYSFLLSAQSLTLHPHSQTTGYFSEFLDYQH